MSEETPLDRARNNITGIVSLLVTGLWMAALFTGVENWWIVLIIGYAVVLPLAGILAGEDQDSDARAGEWTGQREKTEQTQSGSDSSGSASSETPLESLRRRYAEGELTDEQFERKLDRLLETETLEDVEEYRERASNEREREREYE